MSPHDAARAAALIGELKKSLLGAVTQAMGQGIQQRSRPAALACARSPLRAGLCALACARWR